MLTFLLAAALAATAPVTQLNPETDAPAICLIQFTDNVNRIQSGGEADSKVVEAYAEKAKMTSVEKDKLKDRCAFFDLGALYMLNQVIEANQIKTNNRS